MKRFFTRGLVAVLPLVLTAVVLYFVIGFLYNNVGVPIGEALKWATTRFLSWSPENPETRWFFTWGAPFMGFAVGVVLTFVLGFLVATLVGKKLYQYYEAVLKRLPIVRVIYPYAKQLTDFFFPADGKKVHFKHAVAVPFPSPGVYSIGFVTGDGMKSLNEATRKHLVCVFVPNAPTAISGFVIYVPREEVIPLPLSVEEAMRIVISAGVIHPPHQSVTHVPIFDGGRHFAVPEELSKRLGERAPGP